MGTEWIIPLSDSFPERPCVFLPVPPGRSNRPRKVWFLPEVQISSFAARNRKMLSQILWHLSQDFQRRGCVLLSLSWPSAVMEQFLSPQSVLLLSEGYTYLRSQRVLPQHLYFWPEMEEDGKFPRQGPPRHIHHRQTEALQAISIFSSSNTWNSRRFWVFQECFVR